MENMTSSKTVFVVLTAIVVLYFVWGQRVEAFQSVVPIEHTMREYEQDVRVLASYVGPYIGEIYAYLRAKYSDPGTMSSPSGYQPNKEDQVTLSDSLLPIARTQVTSWIDSARKMMLKKYGAVFLDAVKVKHNLTYEINEKGVLRVLWTKNGVLQSYIM